MENVLRLQFIGYETFVDCFPQKRGRLPAAAAAFGERIARIRSVKRRLFLLRRVIAIETDSG
jgi:hypothetical protein